MLKSSVARHTNPRKNKGRRINMVEVRPIHPKEAKIMVSKYHYLGKKAFCHSFCFGIFENQEFIGAIVFHGVSAPETVVSAFGLERNQQEGIFEIGRLVLRSDCNGKNFGSMLVGRSIKQLRKLTNTRAIITYADSTFHNGAVYQACNFTYCGMSAIKKDFWVNNKRQERGKTKGLEGFWQLRSQKHRYIMIFDKSLSLKWRSLAYPKHNPTPHVEIRHEVLCFQYPLGLKGKDRRQG